MPDSAKSHRFKVALSFPGEHRQRVETIANALAARLGQEAVLYDKFYSAEFARPNLDIYLPRLYHDQSQLLVFFHCEQYNKKEWCGLEWRAARDLLKHTEDDRLMFLRLDQSDTPGLYSIDGYLDIHAMPDAEVAAQILKRLSLLTPALAASTTFRTFTSKLPTVDSLLIGRDKELEFLDQAWADPKTNIVQVIAPGGTGKTALMDKWYKRHLDECTIFGWSFYSQGVREDSQTSSAPFFAEIEPFFGITVPQGATVWTRAEAIANHLRHEKVLLILDGLEPLQQSTGEIRDSAMAALLHELRTKNAGMVLCTTRVYIKDLPKDELSAACDLQNLEPQDGASLLRAKGVEGTQEELEQASRDFHNHALAVTLLGTYLKEFHNGDIRRRADIRGLLDDESDQDGHANRVMESYVRRLQGKPELDILKALGYFDRPAESEALRIVLKNAPQRLLLNRLKKLGLILSDNPTHEVDCHPLVREFFSRHLRETVAEQFMASHLALYEYYSKQAPEKPMEFQEMLPLFRAVYHGCQAGKHQEVCEGTYQQRIHHGGKAFYLIKRLGEWGTNLSLLANFFIEPWSQPVQTLSESDQSWVISEAAFALRALGRLSDAIAPMHVGAELYVKSKNWKAAAITYGNLSELYSIVGNLPDAVDAVRHSVQYADQSGDEFERYSKRAMLAAALHHSGDLPDAVRWFREAEQLKAKHTPQAPLLWSLQGFQYCDLLLDQAKPSEVLRRATSTLKLAEEHFGPLNIGLDNLSLGRAYPPGSPDSSHHLDQAVALLRRTGRQDYLPLALLARATEHDLDKAFRIATRSGMRLHLADYHLIQARRLKSIEHFKKAEELINATGYGRRKGALEELRKELNAS